MNATCILFALPAAPTAAGLIFLAGLRGRWSRWPALGWSLLTLPALSFMIYRLWDHHVGPDTFSFWRLSLSPKNMAILLPLAAVSPFLLAAAEGRGPKGWRENVSSACSCFALAAAFTAVMSDHFFLLACMFALASLFMVGAALSRKKESRRFLPAALIPLGLSDLCLSLGALFMYLSDPGRGLFFPALPLEPRGKLAAACALMLAAALLRLGCIPFQRRMAAISRGGKEFRLIHLLAVDLVLGTYLLYQVTQVFFRWEGAWVWICFGVSVVTLLEALRELLSSTGRVETWGLLVAALGANLALVASPGGQMASAALCLGLWAGIPALALLHIGSEGGRGRDWARVLGGVSLLGLPPLAGFIWRWMEYQVLAGKFAGGVSVLFAAAIPLVFAAALIEGFTALLLPGDGGEETPRIAAVTAGMALIAALLTVGLYAGNMVDLLVREYGLPVNLPFTSWKTLGWAVLICSGIAFLVLYARTSRKGEVLPAAPSPARALPLMTGKKIFSLPSLKGKTLAVILACDGLLYAAWIAAMIYLALK